MSCVVPIIEAKHLRIEPVVTVAKKGFEWIENDERKIALVQPLERTMTFCSLLPDPG